MPTSERFYLIRPEDKKKLIQVAMGLEMADLAIINGTLLNVYTGELFDHYSVCTKGKWIAYVGQNPENMIGTQTEVIDAGEKTIIPGLIDGHTHLALFYSVSEFLKYAMTGGTTTLVTETMEPFPVMGYSGVMDFLDSINNQPVKIFATAPFMASISRKAHGISNDILRKLLKRDEIIGLGESYWQTVLQQPDRALPILNETLGFRKTLEGHSAGASGNKLMAYVAAGISSCHEPIQAEEVIERLRLGLHVMIREGSIRRDLKAISKIKDAGADLRRLILVTDGDSVAQRAVEQAAKNIGGRCISSSGGNPTPITGDEIISLVKDAKHDPVVVMVDDMGDSGTAEGEKALYDLANHPDIHILGVVAVAANTPGVEGIKVDFSVTSEGQIYKGAVDKQGSETRDDILYGDTVDIIDECNNIPVVVGVGDIGKMHGRDNVEIGAPIVTKAMEEILKKNGYKI